MRDCFNGQSGPKSLSCARDASGCARRREVCPRLLDHVGGDKSAARHFVLGVEADDNDGFVDIMSSITAVDDAESEGWSFADRLARKQFVSGDVGRGCYRHISIAYLLAFFLHSPLVFSLKYNMVGTHISHKLGNSARLFIKKASKGYCVLVFDSSVEPAAHPGINDACARGLSRTNFEVGLTGSCEEGADATINAPIGHESSMG